MPRKKEVDIYSFDELSESAKETARDWFREGNELDADYVLDDAVNLGEALGIRFRKADVYYDLGRDGGASFSGSYHYQPGVKKAVKSIAPQDTDLHAIADKLTAAQKRNANKLEADVSQGRRDGVSIDVTRTDDKDVKDGDEDEVEEALRDFMHWIYSRLDGEWEYMNSEEAVDESIRANEYEFDERGRPA